VWAQQLTGPAMLQPVEAPAPAAGDLRPGEVLVAPEHGGICGSDLPYFRAGGRPLERYLRRTTEVGGEQAERLRKR
jgi:L-iditol 2-dehydrogenase